MATMPPGDLEQRLAALLALVNLLFTRVNEVAVRVDALCEVLELRGVISPSELEALRATRQAEWEAQLAAVQATARHEAADTALRQQLESLEGPHQ